MQDKIKNPSELEIQNLIKLYQDDQLDEAEKISLLLTQKFPLHQLAWKVLGIIIKKKRKNKRGFNH